MRALLARGADVVVSEAYPSVRLEAVGTEGTDFHRVPLCHLLGSRIVWRALRVPNLKVPFGIDEAVPSPIHTELWRFLRSINDTKLRKTVGVAVVDTDAIHEAGCRALDASQRVTADGFHEAAVDMRLARYRIGPPAHTH